MDFQGQALLEIGELEAINAVVQRRLGKRVSPATIWRWVRKGVRGCKLESIFARGSWCTTAAAFNDFLARQTAERLADNDGPRGNAVKHFDSVKLGFLDS